MIGLCDKVILFFNIVFAEEPIAAIDVCFSLPDFWKQTMKCLLGSFSDDNRL